MNLLPGTLATTSEGSALLIYQCSREHFPHQTILPTSLCCLRCVEHMPYFSGAQAGVGGSSCLFEVGRNAWTTSPRSLFVLAWGNGSEYFLMETSEVEIPSSCKAGPRVLLFLNLWQN